jgi:hypothetical protein
MCDAYNYIYHQYIFDIPLPIHYLNNMKQKIISYSKSYLQTSKYPRLNLRMIVSLLAAVEKQKKKISFGPNDIRGSIAYLISQGLIVRKKIVQSGYVKYEWQVTAEAIDFLKNLEILT